MHLEQDIETRNLANYFILMHKETTLAYFAGIIDGEGHFSIVKHTSIKRHHLNFGVMNTDTNLLSWLRDNFGGTIYHRKTTNGKEHWKQRYEWRLYQKDFDYIIPLVLPFLVVKRQQAELCLEFRKTFNLIAPRSGLPEEIHDIRDQMRLELKKLNGRRSRTDTIS